MLSRRLASLLLLVLPATAACTDEQATTKDAARLVAASGPRVVVAASSETEQPSLGCGGGGDPLLGPSVLFVSDDSGVHYERIEPSDARPLVRVGVRNGVFYGIAQGNDASSFSIVSSTDGRTWTELASRQGVPHDLSLAPDGIAVAYSDGVISSPDGVTWTNRVVTGGLYAPAIAQVGGKLVLASPESGGIKIANGTGWDVRSVPHMQSIYELIPAGDSLIVTGHGLFDNDPHETAARVDLSGDSAPTYVYASTVHPVVTPIGLLDTSGQLAAIEGTGISPPTEHIDRFESATVDGNTVQVLRNGTISISSDGGLTFGAPIALPIVSYQ